MCLIATYSETEKRNQISKVEKMMENGRFRSESELKNFLYNLSFMNNMVVKGYCKERTEQDCNIYRMKNEALEWIVTNYPERCRVSFSESVLYVYSSSRQYSYHFRNFDYRTWHTLAKAKQHEWNGITEGFMLSDEEYKARTAKRHNNPKVTDWKKEFGAEGVCGYLSKFNLQYHNDDEVIRMRKHFNSILPDGNIIMNYMDCFYSYQYPDGNVKNKLMAYVIRWSRQELHNEQWERQNIYHNQRESHFMEELAKAAQSNKSIQRTKAWQNKDICKLFDLYAKKFGLDEGAFGLWNYTYLGFPEEIIPEGEDLYEPNNTIGRVAYRFYNQLKKQVTTEQIFNFK